MRGVFVALAMLAASAGAQVLADPFQGMSPQGRAALSRAVLAGPDAELERRYRAARERVLDVLVAEPLDRAALAAAVAALAQVNDELMRRRREALVDALASLSAADRRAFAEASRRQPPGATLGPRP
ncbi:MAG: periplasmic heavy metal sensor [Thermaurantiacus sp.]|uniref:periplasmic heavy metal sensor n=1 Tax=Thermaurantiacus sp. TaxID=2820283 RepID=UPI00298EEA16|nr:periplasmic heavy metal sensor [Thermaurantiacus sp.]MDW8415749.1 periplasmic heavy metal sensor [Thermaurantiacus sp.]